MFSEWNCEWLEITLDRLFLHYLSEEDKEIRREGEARGRNSVCLCVCAHVCVCDHQGKREMALDLATVPVHECLLLV